MHDADEERAEMEEDEILYCDPDYDPEAARLAELDELERAELLEESEMGEGGFRRGGAVGRGRRGRGGFRGRGPRVRGGVTSSRGGGLHKVRKLST